MKSGFSVVFVIWLDQTQGRQDLGLSSTKIARATQQPSSSAKAAIISTDNMTLLQTEAAISDQDAVNGHPPKTQCSQSTPPDRVLATEVAIKRVGSEPWKAGTTVSIRRYGTSGRESQMAILWSPKYRRSRKKQLLRWLNRFATAGAILLF